MLSPITASSGHTSRVKFGAVKATAPSRLRPLPATDVVRFSGNNNANTQTSDSGWKKYVWPGLETASGAVIAAMGIPMHIIPGIGNMVGIAMNIVGALMMGHGGYVIYQRATAKTNNSVPNDQTNQSTGRIPATPNQQQPVAPAARPIAPQQTQGRGGGFLQNMGSNVATGVGLGMGASVAQEGVHAGVEHFKHRDDDNVTDSATPDQDAAHGPAQEPSETVGGLDGGGDIGGEDVDGGGWFSGWFD